MTDMVRIHNRQDGDQKVLHDVASAIETPQGVLVEYEQNHEMYEGYRLVGFGR